MRYTGEIAALLTTLCWTISALSFSAAGRRVGSLSVNLIRLVLAGGFLTLHGLVFRSAPLPLDAPGTAWLWLLISGFVGFFLGDLCLFRAFVLIGPRLTTLLMSLAPPVAAAVGFVVLNERLTPLNWLGMVITLGGVSWVVIERQPNAEGLPRHPPLWGVTLGVLAAVGQAAGLVLGKLGMGDQNYDPFASTQIRVFAGIAGFALLLAALRWYPRVFATLREPRALGLITLGSFTGPYLGVALLLLSVQHISTGVAQTIVALLPVLILPFVVLLHKERVSLRAVFGACVAVGGVTLLFTR